MTTYSDFLKWLTNQNVCRPVKTAGYKILWDSTADFGVYDVQLKPSIYVLYTLCVIGLTESEIAVDDTWAVKIYSTLLKKCGGCYFNQKQTSL